MLHNPQRRFTALISIHLQNFGISHFIRFLAAHLLTSFPVLFKSSVVSQSIMKNLPCLDFAHNEAVFLNAAVIRVQQRIGICFADPDGRIILCNNRMRRLSFTLSGHGLQIVEDLEPALAQPDPSVTVKDDCFILPDRTVWQFHTQNIVVDSDNRWQQMTAPNVTELYYGNLRQAEINRELKEVNRKLQKMYEHMADDIRRLQISLASPKTACVGTWMIW